MEAITTLLELPDQVQIFLLSLVSPQTLARLSSVSKDLARVAEDEELWASHCAAARLLKTTTASSKTRYARYAVQLCYECRRPTPYRFVMLRRRLCEECEKGHPHKYLMATARQLQHTKSSFQDLSRAQQSALLPQLQSVDIQGFTWYLRDEAIQRAEELLGDAGDEVPGATAAEDEEEDAAAAAEAAAAPVAAAEEEGEEGEEALEDGAIARQWEEAAEEHSRALRGSNPRTPVAEGRCRRSPARRCRGAGQQTPKAAARAERRAAQKENKKRCKEEKRERRQGRGGAPPPAAELSPSRRACRVA